MKVKSFNKKLSLKKETIAHLGKKEMKQVNGGGTGYPCATRTCTPTKCWC
jgi:natural product precursor